MEESVKQRSELVWPHQSSFEMFFPVFIFHRYRNFPIAGATSDEADSIRPYRCNFLGTVYSNSSREVLLKVLGALDIREQCYVKPRTE